MWSLSSRFLDHAAKADQRPLGQRRTTQSCVYRCSLQFQLQLSGRFLRTQIEIGHGSACGCQCSMVLLLLLLLLVLILSASASLLAIRSHIPRHSHSPYRYRSERYGQLFVSCSFSFFHSACVCVCWFTVILLRANVTQSDDYRHPYPWQFVAILFSHPIDGTAGLFVLILPTRWSPTPIKAQNRIKLTCYACV